MNNFGTMQPVTQLELDGFAKNLQTAEEAADGTPLTPRDIYEREMAAKVALKDKLEGDEMPSWAARFNDLLNSNVPWKIAAYVAWASTPKDRRWPANQERFAIEVLGLTSDRRIAEWRRKYPTIDMMIANLQSQEFLEDRADVLYALKTMAKQINYKSAKDRENYLMMTGDLVKTTKLEAALRKVGISKDDLVEMSDAELDVLATTLKNKIGEREKDASGNEAEE